MSIVSLFSASYCHGDEIAREVRDKLDYRLSSDDDLLVTVSERFGVSEDKLWRAIHKPGSLFDQFTHAKERHLAVIRVTLAKQIQNDNLLYHGFAGHLLTGELDNVLRVCLVAKADYRIALAAQTEGIGTRNAEKRIRASDEERARWIQHLFGLGPWDESLYDMLLPMDGETVEGVVQAIATQAAKLPVVTTSTSRHAMGDFLLGSQVKLALVENGYYHVEVTCENGEVTLTINRFAIRVEHLKEALRRVAASIPGVCLVRTKIGPGFRPPGMYEKMLADYPPKVLLVDDEKEFVRTLSERLQTRNFDSSAVYDGEEALSFIETETPEVMVIDLKMPGIDGMEVLRQVKRRKPSTAVIILTGHGSDEEERLAMELGAFAFLRKPVEADILGETIKRACNTAEKN